MYDSKIPEHNPAKQAIILARVSSKDQEEGYSLEVQSDRLDAYCQRKRLHVIERFRLVESSTKGNRKRFNEIIKLIKLQREPVALVADKVDRVQRSQKETPILDKLIKAGQLELHFHTEGYVIHRYSSAHEHMIWGTGVVFARFYTDLLSENIKKSVTQKTKQHGEWFGWAPLGYLNQRDERGRRVIGVDPVRGPLIKKAFEAYATGRWTFSELVREVEDWGLLGLMGSPVNKAVLHRLLQNPFYYGYMLFKGELLPHVHEKLISKETFDACQAVRLGWHKKPFKYGGKDFLFRGLLTCASNNRVISAEVHSRQYKNGKRGSWCYLRTWSDAGKRMWVREDKVIDQVHGVLDQLKWDKGVLEKTISYLWALEEERQDTAAKQLVSLRQEREENRRRQQRLIDLVTDSVLTSEEFLERKEALKKQQYVLDDRIAVQQKNGERWMERLVGVMKLGDQAKEIFIGSNMGQKREFLNFVFSNLQLREEKLEYSMGFPFCAMVQQGGRPENWKE